MDTFVSVEVPQTKIPNLLYSLGSKKHKQEPKTQKNINTKLCKHGLNNTKCVEAKEPKTMEIRM